MLIVMVLMIPRLVLGNLKTSEVIKRIKYCTEGHQKQSLLSEMFNETPSGTDKTELNNNGNELKEKLDHLCQPYLNDQFSSYELLKLLAIPIQQQLRNVAGAQSIWLQQGVRLSVALSIFQI